MTPEIQMYKHKHNRCVNCIQENKCLKNKFDDNGKCKDYIKDLTDSGFYRQIQNYSCDYLLGKLTFEQTLDNMIDIIDQIIYLELEKEEKSCILLNS